MIKKCIRDVIVLIGGSEFQLWLALPQYHYFQHLQSLSVYTSASDVHTPSCADLVLEPAPRYTTTTGNLPQRLGSGLKNLGLSLDGLVITLSVVTVTNQVNSKQALIATLEEDIGSSLECLNKALEARGKLQQSKQVDWYQDRRHVFPEIRSKFEIETTRCWCGNRTNTRW